MCAYINKIGHNRAIRPYHPSNSKLFYSILLAFVPYPPPDRLSMIGGGGGMGGYYTLGSSRQGRYRQEHANCMLQRAVNKSVFGCNGQEQAFQPLHPLSKQQVWIPTTVYTIVRMRQLRQRPKEKEEWLNSFYIIEERLHVEVT